MGMFGYRPKRPPSPEIGAPFTGWRSDVVPDGAASQSINNVYRNGPGDPRIFAGPTLAAFSASGSRTPPAGPALATGLMQNDPRCTLPTPGLSRKEFNRRVNHSAERSADRHRDLFSLPSLEDRAELFSDSVPGGPNDAKAHIPGAAENGNWLFGAEAAARGIGLREALKWGANAQIVQDLRAGKRPTGNDAKGDPGQIRHGYEYYMAGCSKR